VPTCAVGQQEGVGARGDATADLGQVQVHHAGIGVRQDERSPGAACRADDAEQIGPLVAEILRRYGPQAAPDPDPLSVPCCLTRASSCHQISSGLAGRDAVSTRELAEDLDATVNQLVSTGWVTALGWPAVSMVTRSKCFGSVAPARCAAASVSGSSSSSRSTPMRLR
jgi:hypothetical protein